jgi:hypothetical protein
MEHELRDSEKPNELRPNLNQFYNLEQDLQSPPSDFEGGFSSIPESEIVEPSENQDVPTPKPTKPKHYFDVFTGSVIDRKFYKYFERSGVNPENIMDLGSLLRETKVPERPFSYKRFDTSKSAKELLQDRQNEHSTPEKYTQRKVWNWSEERYKRHGRWLYNAVSSPNRNGEKHINKEVIFQANRLGLGPGKKPIIKTLGGISKLYELINAKEVYSIGAFDNWPIAKFIKHIQWVGAQVGKKPTRELLNDYARSNPWRYPSARIIETRLSDKLDFMSPALELSGYMEPRYWSREDYLYWGVKFMKANGGLEISSPILNYLSPSDLGPSSKSIRIKFGINNYKQQVKEAYESELAEEKEKRVSRLYEIEQAIQSDRLPDELFESAQSEDDILLYYAKYQVIHHLCPNWEESTKIIVSTRGFLETNFIGSIRKLNNAITAGDIESAALYLDVFDDIWPMSEYMQTYKLNYGYAEYRKVLAEKDKVRSKAKTLSGLRRKK